MIISIKKLWEQIKKEESLMVSIKNRIRLKRLEDSFLDENYYLVIPIISFVNLMKNNTLINTD